MNDRDVLELAYELSQYAAAPIVMGYKSASGLTVTTPEWWEGLRDRIQAIQPRLEAALAANPATPKEPIQEYEPVYLVSSWSRGYEQTSKEKFGRFEDQDRWLLYKKTGE